MDAAHILLPILKKIPLFVDLDENEHRTIIEHITLQYFPTNYVIFKEGDMGGSMYIIKDGGVRIFHPSLDPEDPTRKPEVLKELGPNDFFGEMALISNKPRNASAQATAETEVFVLKSEDFMKLVSTTASLATKISREFLDRFKDNMHREKEKEL